MVNWSHGDPTSRLHIPVGVAYGSDIAHVRTALLDVARSHPDVLSDPRPRVEFRSFGDSALQFELLVWTRDPRIQSRLASDLNYRIEASLRRHKVRIPFPQRDLHLRSPQLEHLLNAWSHRHFTETELSTPNGHDSMPASADGEINVAQGFEDDLGPRNWSDEHIEALIARMHGPEGVPLSDRRHLLTVYRKCFIGREAVDWMTRALMLTRQEAVELGQLLIDRGIIRHVLDEHGFADGNLFYRFCQGESRQSDSPQLLAPN